MFAATIPNIKPDLFNLLKEFGNEFQDIQVKSVEDSMQSVFEDVNEQITSAIDMFIGDEDILSRALQFSLWV